MAHPALPADFDVNDPDTYAVRLPVAEWAELRRTAPVWWQAQPRGRDGFDDGGHWVVTRHADVKEISRKDAVFSTWENTAIVRFHEGREGEKTQDTIGTDNDRPRVLRERLLDWRPELAV